MRRLAAALCVGLALSLAPMAAGGTSAETVAARVPAPGFSTTERQLIANYFLRHDGHLIDLSPGQRRQLVNKGRVPPGIARKALPGDLLALLSPAPAGLDRVMVGPDVLLVEAASGLIVDILRDVVR
ncbi:hypothetical protein [Zavarzinia compransoris]|uniref:DUF1236 domain-containing protein n=1 Tax=Zavarzinia compransoris TaxID=1264899 RepID=A0A317DWJ3_9PROT|nr:hypothetical protein [Zavarzinia compransoris]PWR18714.1 hypothetical protein DKG75_17130 [Zavarzinia compransoris]TDP48693.1 hypothetical protein DES42_10149 [Zavarzinia compransoris]